MLITSDNPWEVVRVRALGSNRVGSRYVVFLYKPLLSQHFFQPTKLSMGTIDLAVKSGETAYQGSNPTIE